MIYDGFNQLFFDTPKSGNTSNFPKEQHIQESVLWQYDTKYSSIVSYEHVLHILCINKYHIYITLSSSSTRGGFIF